MTMAVLCQDDRGRPEQRKDRQYQHAHQAAEARARTLGPELGRRRHVAQPVEEHDRGEGHDGPAYVALGGEEEGRDGEDRFEQNRRRDQQPARRDTWSIRCAEIQNRQIGEGADSLDQRDEQQRKPKLAGRRVLRSGFCAVQYSHFAGAWSGELGVVSGPNDRGDGILSMRLSAKQARLA